MVLGYTAVTPNGLKALRDYKYSSIDKSPFSKYVLQPYWTFVTTLFPLWMAPNLITLLGFSGVFVHFLLCMFLVPDMLTPGPSWLYFGHLGLI